MEASVNNPDFKPLLRMTSQIFISSILIRLLPEIGLPPENDNNYVTLLENFPIPSSSLLGKSELGGT